VNVSFEQLKSMVVFAQVVEQGSLSAAAKHIGLSRAVVSYHVKKLETHLGLTLLNRTTRSFTLSEAGQQYYQRCRNIAEQAEAANLQIENLKQEPEGLLKITCPVNMGLKKIVPALNAFKKLYPKIKLDVMLTDELVNIMQEGIDLAIRGAPLVDSGLQASKLATLTTCLCASPEYLDKRGRPRHPNDLEQHDWVLYKLVPELVSFIKGKNRYSISVKGSISTNNAAARTAFVEGGHGLARIPLYDALPKIKKGTLEQLLTDYSLVDINIYAVYPPGTSGAKKLRLVIDYLKNYLERVE
jgi:DNA-binding transcriptional LysR family regulator